MAESSKDESLPVTPSIDQTTASSSDLKTTSIPEDALFITSTTSIDQTNSATSTVLALNINNISEPVIITVSICMVVLIAIIVLTSACLILKKMRNKPTQELEPRVV